MPQLQCLFSYASPHFSALSKGFFTQPFGQFFRKMENFFAHALDRVASLPPLGRFSIKSITLFCALRRISYPPSRKAVGSFGVVNSVISGFFSWMNLCKE